MIALGSTSLSKIYLGNTEVVKAYLGATQIWPIVSFNDAVRFTSDKGISSVGFSNLPSNYSAEYSLNSGATWNTFESTTSIALSQGQSVYVRGTLTNPSTSSTVHMTITGNVSAHGNANRLIDYGNESDTTLPGNDAFYYFFGGCDGLVDASDLTLPATTLTARCYKNMFSGCENLMYGPATLPATHLTDECYSLMFASDDSLLESPVIVDNSTHSGERHAYGMFRGCYSIGKVTCLWHHPYQTSGTEDPWTTDWLGADAGTQATNPTLYQNPNITKEWTANSANGYPSGWTLRDYQS